MKIVILSMFSVPTGHTKVAEVLRNSLSQEYPNAEIKIIDFLTFSSSLLEKMVSNIYYKWIRESPESYKSFYQKVMMKESDQSVFLKSISRFSPYFENKVLTLVKNEKPSLLMCTHSFPSRIIGKIKSQSNNLTCKTVNVYTDFFVNDVWEKEQIDYHLVSTEQVKQKLVTEHRISPDRVYYTGIPVSEVFKRKNPSLPLQRKGRKHVLVAGGNSGLCMGKNVFRDFSESKHLQFSVLCGHNHRLYRSLLEKPNITPYMYIEDLERLNDIYDSVDCIITKPGGVTISEVLHKQIPVFIFAYLPGQEEFNLTYLLERNLVFHFDEKEPFSSLEEILYDPNEVQRKVEGVERYLSSLQYGLPEVWKKIQVNTRQKFNMNPVDQKPSSEIFLSG
ncbi:UDP-N-acetylglucosamine--LPS N-acetylglucosamine transferase (plasmid) [Pseudalkalibacillus hwajinpoensis]|uniref:MGDG synthase family glycosyltransferase n=1 Tax=Guptibacillus hwajinpoensis TaxID=208199 RepID=UPI00325BF7CA